MKLKGIRTIALLLAAAILVIGSVAGLAAAGAAERSGHQSFGEVFSGDEGWRYDACYWWQAPPLTPCDRNQMKDIMVHIFNHYFGIDISRKSPIELVELGYAIGHEKQQKALRLFWSYAEQRGFELLPGTLDVPAVPREEFIPPPDAYYWWEFIDPERWCDEWLARMKEEFPDIDIMRLTPEEMDDLLNPPAPPLRLVPVEEKKQCPGVHAIFGRARTYSSEAEIRDWLDRLGEVIGGDPPLWRQLRCTLFVCALAVSSTGYIRVDLDANRVTREDVVALAPKIYALIAERAEELGIEDVPVTFHRTRFGRMCIFMAEDPDPEMIRVGKIIYQVKSEVKSEGQNVDPETILRLINERLIEDRTQIAPPTMEQPVPEEVHPGISQPTSSNPPPPFPPPHQKKDRPISGGVRMEMEFDNVVHYLWRAGRIIGSERRPITGSASTGFAVIHPNPWPWPDDVDYTITGHSDPPVFVDVCVDTDRILYVRDGNAPTPVNHQVFQASVARTERGGVVEAVASIPAYADVARVGIDNWHVEPDILSVGAIEEPVVSWRDPAVHEEVWASGIATGPTHGWVMEKLQEATSPTFGTMRSQFKANLWSEGGDSGGPVFRRLSFNQVEVVGIVWGGKRCDITGLVYTIFSPISGVMHELPGWYPYTK